MKKSGNNNNGKKGRVLDLNTKILIAIRDELREIKATVQEHSTILKQHSAILKEHSTILKEHSTILKEHTMILQRHEERLEGLESAVKQLAREIHKWVSHFDRDYMRLANEVDLVRARLQKCEEKLALQ